MICKLLNQLPEGIRSPFIAVKDGRQQGLVFHEGSTAIQQALFKEEGCEALSTLGRGSMLKFEWLPGRWGILRQFLRGGMMKYVLRRYYLFDNRPLSEFSLHARILQLGLPVPRLLGVRWLRIGFFYTGALATEALEGEVLAQWLDLFKEDMEKCRPVLFACGQAIREMHDADVLHADLQVKNIFISGGIPFLLDFDRAVIGKSVSLFRRQCNLLRLRRSFLKLGYRRQFFDIVLEGYGAISFNKWLDRYYKIKGHLSDAVSFRRIPGK